MRARSRDALPATWLGYAKCSFAVIVQSSLYIGHSPTPLPPVPVHHPAKMLLRLLTLFACIIVVSSQSTGTATSTATTSCTGTVTANLVGMLTTNPTSSPSSLRLLTRTQTPQETPIPFSPTLTQTKSPTPSSSFLPGQIVSFSGLPQTAGFNGDGIPASVALLNNPSGVAVLSNGDVFISDTGNHRIRYVPSSSGFISTLAGSGVAGYNGDGINANIALLNSPIAVAVLENGDVYFSDTDNNRLRLITISSSLISTIAGTGTRGFNGDGILAKNAQLNTPTGIAVLSNGDVFFADTDNLRVRLVSASTGLISTLAGTGESGFNGDGIVAQSAKVSSPVGVAVRPNGDVYFSDYFNNRIRLVTAATGLIYSITSGLNDPRGISVRSDGSVYYSQFWNTNVVRIVSATGSVSTVAGADAAGFNGNGILATAALLKSPYGVATSSNGGLFIADAGNHIVRFVTPPVLTPSPSAVATFSAVASPYCVASLYRPLPRTDLVGTLMGNAWYPGTSLPSTSETACRQACCDAPICDAYTFASSELQLQLFQSDSNPIAECFLYTNVTALVPSSAFSSGALLSVYS